MMLICTSARTPIVPVPTPTPGLARCRSRCTRTHSCSHTPHCFVAFPSTATSFATRPCTPSCAPSVNATTFASFLGACTALLRTLDPTLVSTHTRSHFNIASTTRRTSMSSAAPATLTSIRTRFTSRTNLTTSRTFIPLAHPSHPLPHWCPAIRTRRTHTSIFKPTFLLLSSLLRVLSASYGLFVMKWYFLRIHTIIFWLFLLLTEKEDK